MTRGEALHRVQNALQEAGQEGARRFAMWILEHVTSATRLDLLTSPEHRFTEYEWAECTSLLERCLSGEPIQYVLGTAEFYGRVFEVDRHVLIPRPETEQLVEHVLELTRTVPSPRILDVGTGSGCIAVTLERMRPESRLFGCDISADAVRVAAANARRHGSWIVLFEADARRRGFAHAFSGILDAVVANPPYIDVDEEIDLPVNVREHEPRLALIAEPDPLHFYRAIASEAQAVLRPGGWLCFECHEERAASVAGLVDGLLFEGVRVGRDLSQKPRFVFARKT